MNRRLALLTVVLGFAPVIAERGWSVARASEPVQRVMRVGFVLLQSPSSAMRGVAAFWERLHELGWVEGQNMVIEARSADGRIDRLPALMAEVIAHNVDVLVTGGTPAAVAARDATRTVPIVDYAMADPVRSGLVVSLARPGGNLTGLSLGWDKDMAGKWLELLQEAVPRLSTVAVIGPDSPAGRELGKDLKHIGRTRSLELQLFEVREPGALDRAFEQAARKAQAVVVIPDSWMIAHRAQVAAFAAKHRLPALFGFRDFVDAGALMSYGPDLSALWRRTAEYTDKILKGARPSDLPIEQPTKFEFVVNLKTARALGITIPESVLLAADEVIR